MLAGHLGFLCKCAQSAPCPKSSFGMPPAPPGNYVLAATAIWTASVASAEGLRVYMYGFKIFCSSTASEVFEALHGQLLESDAPLAGGLWNALQGLVLLWKALSVSGLLFWPALEWLGGFWRAPEGIGGSGIVWRAPEGIWQALEGSRRL